MRPGRILRNLWTDYSWFLILILGTISLALGYIGFLKNSQAIEAGRTVLDNLYLTLGLISLNSGAVPPPISWELQAARFLVPAVTAYTAFLAFTSLFRQQADRVRLWFLRDHVVICGLGKKGYRLTSQFLQQGRAVVVIDKDESNEWIENARSAGAVIIQGDAGDPELLAKVKLNQAYCLISVVGDDGKNAEIAVAAERISQTRTRGTLTCLIHIYDAQLWQLLREKEFQAHPNPHFRLELFNIFSHGAHLMVQGNPPRREDPSGQPPHVLIIGLGKMGQQVLLESARWWQTWGQGQGSTIKISVVDQAADSKLDALVGQHLRLRKLAAVEPIAMDITSGEFDKVGERFLAGNTCQVDIAYVCLDDETFCLQTGLRLNQQLRKYQVPIVLRMIERGGLARLVGNGLAEGNPFDNLQIFDLLDQTCTAELLQKGSHEILARNLHAVYLAGLKRGGAGSQVDPAAVAWETLPGYLQENNRQLADRIPVLLAENGYRIAPLTGWDAEGFVFQDDPGGGEDEVTRMAIREHENWCSLKKAEGWRYGPEKDPRKKLHPGLLPWESLPVEEQTKNKEFIRTLPRLLAQAGFQIEAH